MGRIEDWVGNACGQAGAHIVTTRAPTATSYKRQEIERSHFNPTTNCEKLSDVDDVIAQQPFWYCVATTLEAISRPQGVSHALVRHRPRLSRASAPRGIPSARCSETTADRHL